MSEHPLTPAPSSPPGAATAVWFAHGRRDVVRAVGPDAVSFLQGQLSQDVAGLAVGASAWSFVLQPTGKVDAWFRVHRLDRDELALDVDAGWGEPLQARIERFKLRTRCDTALDLGVPTVFVRGQAVAGGLPTGWPGLVGSDHFGATTAPDGLDPAAREVDLGRLDALRILAGVPAMGAELTEATIPAEAGRWIVDASVSFTKGCYTGQELVARIDSRGGNVPRHLRGWRLHGPAPAAGAALVRADDDVGVVTSVATADDGEVLGLAYVKRAVEVPAVVTIEGVEAELRPLPEA